MSTHRLDHESGPHPGHLMTYTYDYDPEPSRFQIEHDRQKRLFEIIGPSTDIPHAQISVRMEGSTEIESPAGSSHYPWRESQN
ncbi:MAG: hypothetical protein ACXWOV_11025, partial [Isosphaeraceae bacterium]